MKFFLILSILCNLFIQNCDIIRGCKSKCKDRTRNCVLQNQLFRATTTTTLTSSGSSSTTITGMELEPNNTFLQNFQNAENGIGVGENIIMNYSALISSASDIDIFDFRSGSNVYLVRVVQDSGQDKVNCILYEKLNATGSTGTLQTNTSIPDASFINKGKLTSYTAPYLAKAYLVCSGTANTNYSFKFDTVDTGISGNSPTSTSNTINNYTNFTTLTSCSQATEKCEKQCSSGK